MAGSNDGNWSQQHLCVIGVGRLNVDYLKMGTGGRSIGREEFL